MSQVLAAHEAGYPAQDFHVLTGGRFRGHDEEEEADGVSIDGVIGDRNGAHPADDRELPNRGGAGMRNGYSKTDSGALHGFTLFHRAEYLGEGCATPIGQVVSELGDNTSLVARGQGDQYPLWRQKLSQKHRRP